MRRALLVALGCGLFAACERGGNDELAGELRALRLQLRAAERAPSEPVALVTALAPLRDGLDALAKNQADLNGKQLALTQELQRWSQLLVESSTSAHAEQGRALAARLQQLETSLQEQAQRHREVEAILQGALDRTSDRLDAFLQQLQGRRPPASASPESLPAPVPTPSGAEIKPGASQGAARQGGMLPWLWAALVGAAALGSVWCWRLAATRTPARVAAPANAAEQPATQDLWEAAALLGEVVGRLRATNAGGAVSAAEPPLPDLPLAEGAFDDLFVLEDEPEPEVAHTAVPTARGSTSGAASAPLPAVVVPPTPVVCRMVARDLERAAGEVRRILANDPRVLRRPEPVLKPVGSALEVSFVPLPGLTPGDRSQLEQRLRDAVA